MADTAFITCFEQSVPKQEVVDLQIWLGKPEFKTLTRIIESRAREHTASVANAALQAVDGAPLKMTLADENLRLARRYLDCLEILNQVKDHPGPLTVTKWQ